MRGQLDMELDEQDQEIYRERQLGLDNRRSPGIGDWVEFADGVTRRISHVWDFAPTTAQTSADGSFYLSNDGSVSFSGSLYPGVDIKTLTFTGEFRPASAWFFHHNWMEAHNGIDVMADFRVYRSTEKAPR
jgi:hypothetical protein